MRRTRVALIILLLGLLTTAAVWARSALRCKASVTVELVAEDMTFRGDNPTLYLTPGTRVRLVFRNEADGIVHQVRVSGMNLQSDILDPGDSEALCFTTPERETTLTYACDLHPMMMGQIIVTANPPKPIRTDAAASAP